MRFKDLNLKNSEVDKLLKEGKEFKGISCKRCGLRINLLKDYTEFKCKCGGYIVDRESNHLPYLYPDYGPPASIINFSYNFNGLNLNPVY